MPLLKRQQMGTKRGRGGELIQLLTTGDLVLSAILPQKNSVGKDAFEGHLRQGREKLGIICSESS